MSIERRTAVIIVTLALGAGCGALAWEHARTSRLRHEIQTTREDAQVLSVLAAEKNRLLALQISPDELDQLRRDHEEIEKMRASLVRLGNTAVVEELFRRAVANTHPSKPSNEHPVVAPEPFGKYAGNQTPKAVLDSVIWAANSGNVEELTPLITFDPAGRSQAEELFHRLPLTVQMDYGGPEKVYATLIAANLPLGMTRATIVREDESNGERVTLMMRLQRHNSPWHDAKFNFQRSGTGWQLVVPSHIVENFSTLITGASADSTKG